VSIVKMKKLRLLAVRSEQEALLKELMVLGCVEISDPEPLLSDPETEPLLHRGESESYLRRNDRNALLEAVKLLEQYAPVKHGLFTPKREVSRAELLNEETLQSYLKKAVEIDRLDDRIRRFTVEESRQKSILESLTPWSAWDVPLESTGTKTCALLLGTLPVNAELEAVKAALAEKAPEAELFSVADGPELHYVSLLCLRTEQTEVNEVLRDFGFTAFTMSGMTGTAKANIDSTKKRIEELKAEKQQLSDEIAAFAPDREEMQLCADRMELQLRRAEAADKLVGTEGTVVLTGWVSAPEEEKLTQVLSRYDCAWELTEPAPEEYPEVPIKLKNNKLTRALNMVTEMYSLPAYDSVDPNPLMAPFFVLFYGIMMADMGYGLLMMLAGIIVKKKAKPTGGMRNFFELMLLCGISTFVMGAITGGFFGDAPLQIVKIINPATTWQGLPALFNPLNDTVMILIGAMALGFVQIITGMIISFVKKLQDGQIMDAIWEEVTWWVVFAGIGLFVLKLGNIGNVPVVLCIGILMILVGSGWNEKGFGKVTAIFGSLYNHVTGFFGDILSYSRLMALMLAGSVIAQVFNTIGAIPGNLVVFFIISIVGNMLNFALNLLGCYVHDLRLQCLEYFGKFYKDGGKPFRPLDLQTGFVNVRED